MPNNRDIATLLLIAAIAVALEWLALCAHGAELFRLPFLLATPATITLAWDNEPTAEDASNYVTGIEASGDLVNWRQVALVPYAIAGRVTISNQPASQQFYRAFNALK